MTPKYKAIIVDDEKLARLDLRNVLKAMEEIEIVGEANSVNTAEQLINKLHPNLVFLDIQLRGESGFDLLDKIDADIDFVFVTAYDKYAIRAFEVNAQDYLLKPVSSDRIRLTIGKLTHNANKEAASQRRLNYDDVIFLMLNNRYRFLKIETIVAITSEADYSYIHTNDKAHSITRKTMREWESRLPENHFCRIHRETIVNLEYVTKIDDSLSNSYKVFLKGIEKPFLMSRRYAAKIKEKFF
ncbi:MAG: LytTR family DNA-binding domain-containing protein [Ignavibacteria bacterium]|nr:LytTR family DNA-binding domain-containing protein [Ignavibacteria bacterium]